MAKTGFGKLAGLGAACAAVLGNGCVDSGGGSGGSSGASSSLVTVNAANAGYLAKAALTASVIADSIKDSNYFSLQLQTNVTCADGGVVAVSPSGLGEPPDTVTTPSGGGAPPPPASDTLLEYTDCVQRGFTIDGLASASGTGTNFRLRWLNVGFDHQLIDASRLFGVGTYFASFGDSVQRIDGVTVTRGSDAFYFEGEVDAFGTPRQVRLDLVLRVTNQGGSSGSAQVTTPERLIGTAGMPFDSGVFKIAGDGSSVTVTVLGGGQYRLEVDVDGDDVADTIVDSTAL